MPDGVVAVLIDSNRILVILRGDSVPFPGVWALPSGKVDAGETLEAALVREVFEELGLAVSPGRALWESTSDDGRHHLHWWTANIISGTLAPDRREISEVRWVTPDEFRALEPTFGSDREFLERLEDRLHAADIPC